MSSPGTTDNPGQMLPVRLLAKCTDGGVNDGKYVELVCNSSGQAQSANSSADARSVAVTSAFPAGSVVLGTGKILLASTLDSVFSAYSQPFIVESITVLDKTGSNLDLDIYIDVGSSFSGAWTGTVSEGNYAYANNLAAPGVVGVCKIRSTDYTTQYSAAATAATSVATKALVMSGQSGSASVGINVVVVYAGTSTATVTASKLQIEIVVRSTPLVSAAIV